MRAAAPSLQPLSAGRWVAPSGATVSGVFVAGDYAYVAAGESGFHVIDVRQPMSPVRVGGFATVGMANTVVVQGSLAYVTDSGDEAPLPGAGLQIIDVSDPYNCVRVGGYVVTNGHAWGIAVSGNYAYLASGSRMVGSTGVGVFEVVDVSVPSSCRRVGGVFTGDDAIDVALARSHAFVADGQAGLTVINVRNPTNCVRVGGVTFGGSEHDAYAVAVTVSGNHAYVADSYEGLQIVDVQNPTNCWRAGGSFLNGRNPRGVAVSKGFAYVAANQWRNGMSKGSLQILDLRDPVRPAMVGEYDTGGHVVAVTAVKDRVYVAGTAGLLVLPSVPGFQFSVRVEASPAVPFAIEAATDLSSPSPWVKVFETNGVAMPFDYVDFDVRGAERSRKYYRVRQ